MKYILIIILSLFSLNVSADKCDSKTKSDLLKEANQIKVDYDEIEKTEEVDDGYNKYTAVDRTLNISLYNLTNNFSLEISNDYDDKVIYVESNDIKDGKYTFNDINTYHVVKYKIAVYSNTSCDKYLIKNISYTKPMYNSNYNYKICEENSSVPYCQKYIVNNRYVFDAGKGLDKAIEDYKNNNNQIPGEENKEGFLKKYMVYIIIGGVIVIAGIGVTIVIRKKRSEI